MSDEEAFFAVDNTIPSLTGTIAYVDTMQSGEEVHFAGEHSNYGFAGYMEGALNAGASLAKRLVAQHQTEPAKVPVTQ